MRMLSAALAGGAIALTGIGCSNSSTTSPVVTVANPDSLTYVLVPGQPGQDAAVILRWLPAPDSSVIGYVVYGEAVGGGWLTLAFTPNTAFYAGGTPLNEYYIAAQDAAGNQSSGTAPVTIDAKSPLGVPGGLTAEDLNAAVALRWSPSVRLADQADFAYYRVFSEPAVSGGGTPTCPTGGTGFDLDGTSTSEGFVVTGLTNGAAVCFGVSAMSTRGQESMLSAMVAATPSASGGSFDVTAQSGTTAVKYRASTKRRQ